MIFYLEKQKNLESNYYLIREFSNLSDVKSIYKSKLHFYILPFFHFLS